MGSAGLRVGYAVSHPSVADMLNRVRQAFNVSSVALAGAVAALEDEAHVSAAVAVAVAERVRVAGALRALGTPTMPTAGNFLLLHAGPDALAPFRRAAARRRSSCGPSSITDCREHLRVTLGTVEQNDRFLSAWQKDLDSLTLNEPTNRLPHPSSRSTDPPVPVKAPSAASSPRASGWNLLDSGALYRLVALGGALKRNSTRTTSQSTSSVARYMKVEFGSQSGRGARTARWPGRDPQDPHGTGRGGRLPGGRLAGGPGGPVRAAEILRQGPRPGGRRARYGHGHIP